MTSHEIIAFAIVTFGLSTLMALGWINDTLRRIETLLRDHKEGTK